MVTCEGYAYLAGMTLLSFFWAYGIIRFAMDINNIYLPKGAQYLRGRRKLKEEKKKEKERDEKERQLY
jgi:hypothetical protein